MRVKFMSSKNKQMIKSPGFTLVELSIVIIIIGFLIAGISAGSSLIKQAALNSVVSDMQGFQAAYNNFVLRYNAVPGDMNNAETYWPSGGSSPCSVTADNCNGNGNGIIDYNVFALPDETASAWRELSLANMISTGIEVIPDVWGNQLVPGSNIPASKITGMGYLMVGAGSSFGYATTGQNTTAWNDGSTNAVYLGKPGYPTDPYTSGLDAPALKAEDAFNMDKKIDDGTVNGSIFTGASSGNFRSVNESNSYATHCQDAGEYNLTVDSLTCLSGLALN